MKVHKLALLLVLAGLSVGSQSTFASNGTAETVSVVSRPSKSERPADSSGRQIAVVLPSIPTTHPVLQSASHSAAHSALPAAANQQWKKISSQLPANVDEAADYCVVTANKVGKVASQKAFELSNWVNSVTRPVTNSPGAAASPSYKLLPAKESLQPVEFNNRLWIMPDGRLKTLVPR